MLAPWTRYLQDHWRRMVIMDTSSGMQTRGPSLHSFYFGLKRLQRCSTTVFIWEKELPSRQLSTVIEGWCIVSRKNNVPVPILIFSTKHGRALLLVRTQRPRRFHLASSNNISQVNSMSNCEFSWSLMASTIVDQKVMLLLLTDSIGTPHTIKSG